MSFTWFILLHVSYSFRYYEDLQCTEVDDVIQARLKKNPVVNLPSGKLLERLLTFKMIRDNIPSRYFYSRSNDTDDNKEKPTKALFLPDLIKLAEPKLTSIK